MRLGKGIGESEGKEREKNEGSQSKKGKMREELKKEREGEYGGNWRDSKGRDGKKRRLRVGREKI